MNVGFWKKLTMWTGIILLISFLLLTIQERSSVSRLQSNTCESIAFREQKIVPELYWEIQENKNRTLSKMDQLALLFLNGKQTDAETLKTYKSYLKYKKEDYLYLRDCLSAIWSDLQYFPVASEDIIFENTWLAERTYGGERLHEGCDLFGKKEVSGYYSIVSMTDGIVEKIGWLPLGGYRIGIRSPHGGYFYYAHLSGYEKEFVVGDAVKAGDILGFMGNTGYGEEGTIGQFPVHLHFGIYIKTKNQSELSVNPYWVLKSFEKKIRKYVY